MLEIKRKKNTPSVFDKWLEIKRKKNVRNQKKCQKSKEKKTHESNLSMITNRGDFCFIVSTRIKQLHKNQCYPFKLRLKKCQFMGKSVPFYGKKFRTNVVKVYIYVIVINRCEQI